jgi:hypothetical protein
MFKDLKKAYEDMVRNFSHVTSSNGVRISFPEDLFSKFEQEYNLCFVEQEQDISFQAWQSWQPNIDSGKNGEENLHD